MLQTTTEHTGTLADMLEYLRKLADATDKRGKGKSGDPAAKAEAAGMRAVITELERWTPILVDRRGPPEAEIAGGDPEPVPGFGGYQPGPMAEDYQHGGG